MATSKKYIASGTSTKRGPGFDPEYSHYYKHYDGSCEFEKSEDSVIVYVTNLLGCGSHNTEVLGSAKTKKEFINLVHSYINEQE